jgi:hypothetical protein
MKNLIISIALLVSTIAYSQETPTYLPERDRSKTQVKKIAKPWSLSLSLGYIGIPKPAIGSNVWGSTNLSYTVRNTTITGWGGANYWVEGNAPDLRLGLTITQTLIKF